MTKCSQCGREALGLDGGLLWFPCKCIVPIEPTLPAPDADVTLDSPGFVPQELKDFAARGYERINRHAAPDADALRIGGMTRKEWVARICTDSVGLPAREAIALRDFFDAAFQSAQQNAALRGNLAKAAVYVAHLHRLNPDWIELDADLRGICQAIQ